MSSAGADPGFQVRGGALKKIAPSGGRLENCWGISCEKSRFYDKKIIFFPILRGARAGWPPPPPLDPPLICTQVTEYFLQCVKMIYDQMGGSFIKNPWLNSLVLRRRWRKCKKSECKSASSSIMHGLWNMTSIRAGAVGTCILRSSLSITDYFY